MLPVLCYGDICADLLIPYGQALASRQKDVDPDALTVRFSHGGSVANTAVTLARLGTPALFLGTAGQDAFGRALKAGLTQEGVDASLLTLKASAMTTMVLLVLDEQGERVPFAYPRVRASQHDVSADQIPDDILSRISWMHSSGMTLREDPAAANQLSLMRRCHEAGVTVTSLPGACALITALSVSGFAARRFVFEGFLPQETKERKAVLSSLAAEHRTIILYEAPHRLVKTLLQLQETLGARRICICRELTKIHEEAVWTTLPEAAAFWTENEPRGEYVLVLEGLSEEEQAAQKEARWSRMSLQEHLAVYLAQGLDKKEAMKRMASDRGVSRREIYQGLLEED